MDDSKAKALQEKFKSRSASKIIDGLGELLGDNIERYAEIRAQEVDTGEYSKDASQVGNMVFTQGVQLAKLINPQPLVAVQVNNGNGVMAVGAGNVEPTEKELVSKAVKALTAAGVTRDQLTTAMVEQAIKVMDDEDAFASLVREVQISYALPEASVDDDDVVDAEVIEDGEN